MAKEIEIKKKNFAILLILTVVLLVIVSSFLLYRPAFSIQDYSASELEGLSLESKFEALSQSRTNSCGGGESYVSQLSADGTRIQGSCCSAMDLHRYGEQIEGLKEYSNYKIIPNDPYDVSSKWADEMIKYTGDIILTNEQQAVYDEAMSVSGEGGPCCCKCWHWYAYEGLAKYLIVEENFTAEQVAEVWDLSDACGGSGHIEGGGHGH